MFSSFILSQKLNNTKVDKPLTRYFFFKQSLYSTQAINKNPMFKRAIS